MQHQRNIKVSIIVLLLIMVAVGFQNCAPQGENNSTGSIPDPTLTQAYIYSVSMTAPNNITATPNIDLIISGSNIDQVRITDLSTNTSTDWMNYQSDNPVQHTITTTDLNQALRIETRSNLSPNNISTQTFTFKYDNQPPSIIFLAPSALDTIGGVNKAWVNLSISDLGSSINEQSLAMRVRRRVYTTSNWENWNAVPMPAKVGTNYQGYLELGNSNNINYEYQIEVVGADIFNQQSLGVTSFLHNSSNIDFNVGFQGCTSTRCVFKPNDTAIVNLSATPYLQSMASKVTILVRGFNSNTILYDGALPTSPLNVTLPNENNSCSSLIAIIQLRNSTAVYQKSSAFDLDGTVKFTLYSPAFRPTYTPLTGLMVESISGYFWEESHCSQPLNQSINVKYSDNNGATWLNTLSATGTGSQSGLQFALPNIDSSSFQLKLVVNDGYNNTREYPIALNSNAIQKFPLLFTSALFQSYNSMPNHGTEVDTDNNRIIFSYWNTDTSVSKCTIPMSLPNNPCAFFYTGSTYIPSYPNSIDLPNRKVIQINTYNNGNYIHYHDFGATTWVVGPEFGPGKKFVFAPINGGGFMVFAEHNGGVYRRAYNANIEPIPITNTTPIP